MTRTIFYGHKPVKATIQPNIGLDAGVRKSVVEMLNLLLADESILALKTSREDGEVSRGDVPELQSLYEAQHKQINAISAELTERIQILGGLPLLGSQLLIDTSRLRSEVNSDRDSMSLLADYETFIRFLREDTQQCFEIYEDQGTFALLVGILRTHEKLAWILRSNIAMEQLTNEI